MGVRCRCSPQRFLEGIQPLSDEKKQSIIDFGFGGLLQLNTRKLNMPLCLWLVKRINVAYAQLQLEGGTTIPITATHVGSVFGIPDRGITLQLEHRRIPGANVPSIYEIQAAMEASEVGEDFRRLFILFACATFLAPTARLEGPHSLWHAPIEAITGDVNWAQFVLDQLMSAVHDFRREGGSYVRGCLMFLELFYVSFSHFPPMPMPTSTPRCAHWSDKLVKKRLKMETDMLGGLGLVQFHQLSNEHDHGVEPEQDEGGTPAVDDADAMEVNEARGRNAEDDHDQPTNASEGTHQNADTVEGVVARMEATQAEIVVAHNNLTTLIGSYVRDFLYLSTFAPRFQSTPPANFPFTGTPTPAEHSTGTHSRPHFQYDNAPSNAFTTASAHASGGATGVGNEDAEGATIADGGETDIKATEGPSMDDGRGDGLDGGGHRSRDEEGTETENGGEVGNQDDDDLLAEDVGRDGNAEDEGPPTDDGGGDDGKKSEVDAREEGAGTSTMSPHHDTTNKRHIEQSDIRQQRKKRTKLTARRIRNRAPQCKSPFLNFCISKYSKLTKEETMVADYAFDVSRDPSEVLCSFGGHDITRQQMQSLGGHGPIDTEVVTCVCRYLNTKGGDVVQRHFIVPEFADKACSMGKNANKKLIRAKLGQYTKGIDAVDQIYIPICQCNHWVVMVLNLQAKRIDILSSAVTYETARFMEQAKKIALFLTVLIHKALVRKRVDVKTLDTHMADILGQTRGDDSGLYAVLYMLNWDGSGLIRGIDNERLPLEKVQLGVLMLGAPENAEKDNLMEKLQKEEDVEQEQGS